MSGGNQTFIAMPKFPREQLQGAKNDLGSEFQRFLVYGLVAPIWWRGRAS